MGIIELSEKVSREIVDWDCDPENAREVIEKFFDAVADVVGTGERIAIQNIISIEKGFRAGREYDVPGVGEVRTVDRNVIEFHSHWKYDRLVNE